MRNLIYTSLLLLAFTNCSSREEKSKVRISNSSDTISIGETIIGEFSYPCIDSILPQFYLINKNDTMLLLFDESKKAAIIEYEAINSIGYKEFSGYVEYSEDGRLLKESFKWSFYVKDTL